MAHDNDSTIRWLHLTDLHVGMNNQDWLWPDMRAAFRDDLRDKIAKQYNAAPWDLVLFTGDLIQGHSTKEGTKEQYDKLDEIFDDMWNWFGELGCSPEFLAVPGNHDLFRPKATKSTVKQLERWHFDDDVSQSIWRDDGDNEYLEEIQFAFDEYTKWWEKTPLKPDAGIVSGRLPGDFSYVFEKNNFKLGIMGLNSAFLQLTNKLDYKGRLVVDPRQSVHACNHYNNDDVAWAENNNANIMMTHHPLSWIHGDYRTRFSQRVMKRFNIHLCGHQHSMEVMQVLSGGASTGSLNWVGRSLFGLEKAENGKLDREHGYALGEISLTEEPQVCFLPRRREELGDLVPDSKGVRLPDDRWTHLYRISDMGVIADGGRVTGWASDEASAKSFPSSLVGVTPYLINFHHKH